MVLHEDAKRFSLVNCFCFIKLSFCCATFVLEKHPSSLVKKRSDKQ